MRSLPERARRRGASHTPACGRAGACVCATPSRPEEALATQQVDNHTDVARIVHLHVLGAMTTTSIMQHREHPHSADASCGHASVQQTCQAVVRTTTCSHDDLVRTMTRLTMRTTASTGSGAIHLRLHETHYDKH